MMHYELFCNFAADLCRRGSNKCALTPDFLWKDERFDYTRKGYRLTVQTRLITK